MLYQNWVKNVFNPMHRKLSEVMEGPMFKEYDSKKRALFEKYLQYRNKKVNNEVYVLLGCFNVYTLLHRITYSLTQWTVDVREYDALQLSSPSSTLKVTISYRLIVLQTCV